MLLKKGKKLLILLLIMLMILGFKSSVFADTVSAKVTRVSNTSFTGIFMLPNFEAIDFIGLRIEGVNYSSEPKFSYYHLEARQHSLIIDKDLELGVNLFIDEKKGTIVVRNALVEIYNFTDPDTKTFIGTETLNFEIQYDPKQPYRETSFKDQNYFDEASGYQVLNNHIAQKEWSAINPPMNFSGYIFGKYHEYELFHDGYTEISIVNQTMLYK